VRFDLQVFTVGYIFTPFVNSDCGLPEFSKTTNKYRHPSMRMMEYVFGPCHLIFFFATSPPPASRSCTAQGNFRRASLPRFLVTALEKQIRTKEYWKDHSIYEAVPLGNFENLSTLKYSCWNGNILRACLLIHLLSTRFRL
jgi:hypothetical protein